MGKTKTCDVATEQRYNIFADCIIKGLSGTVAYKQSHPLCKRDDSAAVGGHRLLRNDKVKALIRTKRQAIQAVDEYTRTKAQSEYEQVRSLAIDKADLTNANSAIRGKARLYGLEIERVEHDHFLGRMPDAGQAIERSKARAKQVQSTVIDSGQLGDGGGDVP